MALQKQTVEISFHKGIDTKTDAFRLSVGNFVGLQNSVFDSLGRMTKRNGFAPITSLPLPASFLTTFMGNLTALGANLQAYSAPTSTWINSGSIQPVRLSTLSLIRNSLNQTYVDTSISSNGLICAVYTEFDGSSNHYKYAVFSADTGQSVIAPTFLEATATFTPKVFTLGQYFIIVYTNHPAGYNLRYIAISQTSLVVNAVVTISASITPSATGAFDGAVYNNQLFLAWNGASGSGIKCVSLTNTLALSAVKNPDNAHVATLMSVCADQTDGTIWFTYYDSGSSTGYVLAISPTLATILAATQIIASGTYLNITSSAQNGSVTTFQELSIAYSYDGAIATNSILSINVTEAGVVGSSQTIIRSLGLASKSFIENGIMYLLGVYSSPYQNTYFLVNATTSRQPTPNVIAKIAYSNGGGYLTTGLPSVAVSGTTASVGYLIKDLITPVNKNTAPPAGSQIAGIYTQTGINLANFDLTTDEISTVEIGSALQFTGGFMWMYDGFVPVEQNFFLYPDSVECVWSASGGSIHAQPDGATNTNAYWYQVIYAWTDNQGNTHRSAPSIPIPVTTTSTGTSGSITVNVPTMRLSYKTNIKIEIYRWSVAQQVYYQVTSVPAPTLNTIFPDSVAFVDTLADATILENSIIYTNGGVAEDTNAPSANALALFDDRVWMINAEDPNLLGFSKQVIENTPVEMSQEFTRYVAPGIAVQKPSGPMKCIFPMDDKLVIFKSSSLYYINGTGPDNTGANSQYSEPIFITSPVGCTNQNSIVLIPDGLMFQAANGAGIWHLGRNLATTYIGAPVEGFNSDVVLSAIEIPGTTRVIFSMQSGIDLVYDYFVSQWGSFKGKPGISNTIYQDKHTYISAVQTVVPPGKPSFTVPSQAFQETPGKYLDGARPVLMSFQTGWISLAGLQGYKRAYWMELLGSYISPHTLGVTIAYDFNPSFVQNIGVHPTNTVDVWGSDATWGSSSLWGGSGQVEQWQLNFQRQQCQSFQLTLNEYFDSSKGQPAGGGLTLSSLEIVVGIMKGFPRNLAASQRTG